jgi:hypothetical protein
MLVEESAEWSVEDEPLRSLHIPRVETAHVMVAFHATIHDCRVSLFPNAFSGNILVHPVRVSPHGRVNLAKLYRRARIIGNGLLEGAVEVTIV